MRAAGRLAACSQACFRALAPPTACSNPFDIFETFFGGGMGGGMGGMGGFGCAPPAASPCT